MNYDLQLQVICLLVLQGREVTLSGGSPGVQHEPHSNVNKLREFWLRGQNALVYDDQVHASHGDT